VFALSADYRLPTFRPHGTKLGQSWFQWRKKSDLTGWSDNLEKGEMCGHLSACRVDPVVALRLRNAADYLLPTFGPRATKLGHSWFQWKMESDFWLVWQFWKRRRVWAFEGLQGWSRGFTPPQENCLRNAADYRLPTSGPHGTNLGHSWLQWKKKEIFLAGLTIKKNVICLGIVSASGGWSNAAEYRLPTFGPLGTKLGHSWFQ